MTKILRIKDMLNIALSSILEGDKMQLPFSLPLPILIKKNDRLGNQQKERKKTFVNILNVT